MQVNRVDGVNNFKANKISKVLVNLPEKRINYDIYKISYQDQPFLDLLSSKVNLRELWRGLRYLDYELWDFILKKTAKFEKSTKNFGYLLVKDKSPCGLMNCSERLKGYKVDYVTTWPYESDSKSPYAGKVLFLQLYKDLLNANKDFVRLDSIKNGPFDVFQKYRSLGFMPIGGDYECEMMKIEKDSIKEVIETLEKQISIKSIDENDEDLRKTLIL